MASFTHWAVLVQSYILHGPYCGDDIAMKQALATGLRPKISITKITDSDRRC